MKKKISWFVACIVLLGSILLCLLGRSRTVQPNGEVLINHFEDTLPMMPKLFYSDINYKHISAFTLEDSNLISDNLTYTPYTEGFIPTHFHQYMYALLEESFVPPTDSFHDYYADEELGVIAFSGDLNGIYIIDWSSKVVAPLRFDDDSNLGSMYVSHITRVDNTLVILGGEANQLASLVYTVDIPTKTVQTAKRILNDDAVRYEDDFALLSSGICLFAAQGGVQIYNPFTDTETFIPLTFDTTHVLAYEEEGIVLCQTEEGLHLRTSTLDTLLPLPALDARIVDLYAKDGYLYLALFDAQGSRFTNYLSIYDLTSGKWMYALGLEPVKKQALLFIEPTT